MAIAAFPSGLVGPLVLVYNHQARLPILTSLASDPSPGLTPAPAGTLDYPGCKDKARFLSLQGIYGV